METRDKLELKHKLENIETLLTSSFAHTIKVNYGLYLEDGNVETFENLLKKLKSTKPNKLNTGFKFTGGDVIQWLLDLTYIVDYYKKTNRINHLQSNTKLRDLIKSLSRFQDIDVKDVAVEVLKEILQPTNSDKKLSKAQQFELDVKANLDKGNLELIKKHSKKAIKGGFIA